MKFKKHKKLIIKSLLLFGICFSLGFIYNYHLPKIESLILINVEKKSSEFLPVRVWPKKAQLSFFPLGIDLQDIHLIPQKELGFKLAPFNVNSASVHISLFKLLLGRVVISNVTVDGFSLSFKNLKNPISKKTKPSANAKKNSAPLFSFDFNILKKIPIESISIKNFKVDGSIENDGYTFDTRRINFTIKKLLKSIYVDLNVAGIKLKEKKSLPTLAFDFSTKFLLNKNVIKFNSLKLFKKNIYFLASGSLGGDILSGKIESADFNSRSHINLNRVYKLIKTHRPDFKIPEVKGLVKLDLGLQKNGENISYNVKSQTQNISIEKFIVGNSVLNGHFKDNVLKLNNLSLDNSSGKVKVKDIFVYIKPKKINFTANVNIQKLEIRQLLENLNIKDIPIHIDLLGNLPCKGSLKPNFKLRCDGNITAKNLHVYSGDISKTIVKAKPLAAKGFLEVDTKKVVYSADLNTGSSSGSSDGVITYKKGFNINYKTLGFDFSDLLNLVNLKIEGKTDLEGNTYGDSSYGRINMKVKGTDLWLEDYFLGSPSSKLTYKKGFLKFTKLKSKLLNSQYYGSISLNLRKSLIYINAKSQYFEAKDLNEVFIRKVKMPIKISGTGTISANVWGPLQFNKLSYDFKTELFRGLIHTESYDQTSVHLQAKKGFVTSKKFTIKKNRGIIDLKGTANPKGILKTNITVRNFRLEESELISTLGLDLIGKIDLNSTLNGPILKPTLNINGNISDIIIAEEIIPPSEFKFEISEKHIKGGARLVGNIMRSKFIFPLDDSSEFLFHLDAQNWKYLRFLSIFSNSKIQKNFDSLLTGSIKLSSKKGGFWNSSGQLKLDKFFIKRGANFVGIQKPLKITANKGTFSLAPFEFSGNESKFKVELNNLHKNNLNAKIQGGLDLSLVSIVTPLEELLGNAKFSINLTGSLFKPKLIGSAFVKDAFIKIDGFDHPFENVNGDFLFNEKQIEINAFNGNLAEGTVRGQGKILINGFKDIPINIKGDFNNVNLKVPEDINTVGSGNISITGSWFPYVLGGNYNVRGGLVSVEFNKSQKSGQKIQPSNFLPDFLTGENFNPLALNLNIKILNELKVKNQLVDVMVNGGLKVTGTPLSPLISGTINLKKGGNVDFRENIFALSEGTVKYTKDKPENPTLFIAADSQIETDDLTYDVHLKATGKVSNLELALSSSPTLKEHEIVSLLALGITNDDLQKIRPEEQAAQTSYQLGSALLATPLGNQIKKRFGVELKISSNFEDDEAVPKFSVKKRFSDKVDASASRIVGKSPKTIFDVKYKFNKNFSVIGLFESKDGSAVDTDSNDSQENKAGVDLEYRIKFK